MAFYRLCSLGRLRRLFFQTLFLIYLTLVAFALFNRRERVRYTMPDVFSAGPLGEKILVRPNDSSLPFCRLDWKSLRLHDVDVFRAPDFAETLAANRIVRPGGQWSPTSCRPFQRVAVIIAYRDREHHLKILLNRLHPMFVNQRLSYRIFVIEQLGSEGFNHGMLNNVGFAEAQKHGDFDCFVFQDVDLVPEHDRNVYMCDHEARHMSSAIDELRYHVMYYQMVGGVLAISADNFKKVNGYSNLYWGWGQEDDDFSARTEGLGLKITRPPEYIGRFKMIRHEKQPRDNHNNEIFLRWRRYRTEGFNSLNNKYRVVAHSDEPLYTNVSVDLGTAPSYDDVIKMTEHHKTESVLWYLRFFFP